MLSQTANILFVTPKCQSQQVIQMHTAPPQLQTLRTPSCLAKSLSHFISWHFRYRMKESEYGRQDVARTHMAKVWIVLSKKGSSQTQQFLSLASLRLLEGSSDFPALQRLAWAPVVHHAAHRLILSTEAKATEFAHLWEKAQPSSNAYSLQQDHLNYTSSPQTTRLN